MDAFLHGGQTVGGLLLIIQLEADAVVAQRHLDRFAPAVDPDLHLVRLGMSQRIGHRLLNDAEQMVLDALA
ncbi:hypothetical protein D3C81_795510 [compost metagenome]